MEVLEAHTKRQLEKLKRQFSHNLEIIKIVSGIDSNPVTMPADRSSHYNDNDSYSTSNASQGNRNSAVREPSRTKPTPSDSQRTGESGELALTEIDKRLLELQQKKNMLKDKLVTSLS